MSFRSTANRSILIGSVFVASWLGMQVVHELGHISAALGSGGRVSKVVLHPLAISRTDYSHNPHPLLVVWGGPMLGVLLPLSAWGIVRSLKGAMTFVVRFFAGFCLLANGLYIGIGSFDQIGDCREMLMHGSSAWQLWLFGAICTPLGLACWQELGSDFGIGPFAKEVTKRSALVMLGIAVALIVGGLFLGE